MALLFSKYSLDFGVPLFDYNILLKLYNSALLQNHRLTFRELLMHPLDTVSHF